VPRLRSLVKGAVETLLILCAVSTAGLALSRFLSPQSTTTDGLPALVRFEGWEEDLVHPRRVGPENAPFRLVVWTDHQCPACKYLETQIGQAREQLGDSIAVIYRYNPLGMHALARLAAIATECAGEQGRLEEMHNALFAAELRGDSLPLDSLIVASHVQDAPALRRCISDPESPARARVQLDIHRALALNLRATPGVQIGNRLSTGAVQADELIRRLRAAAK